MSGRKSSVTWYDEQLGHLSGTPRKELDHFGRLPDESPEALGRSRPSERN
jgi:hypothetical protein